MPGSGIGGLGGVGSMHGLAHGLLKNHAAMTNANSTTSKGMPGGANPAISVPKFKTSPLFKPLPPMPVRKLPALTAMKQPKPMTTAPLGPLTSAPTTRPSFAKNQNA